MAITGSLSEVSIPEVFQFLDLNQKTGLLTIRDLQDLNKGKSLARYIWFQNGRVVSSGNCLDSEGLVRLIEQKGWISNQFRPEFDRLIKENAPLGKSLRSLEILQPEQLKLLFGIQVIRQILSLFELEKGIFRFETNKDLPNLEMTGLSLHANETSLMGLRSLKNWKKFQNKLPKVSSKLFSILPGQPYLRLDNQESQLMELANGSISLEAIAKKLALPILKVRQIAFRLIVVGLVDELPATDGSMMNTNAQNAMNYYTSWKLLNNLAVLDNLANDSWN
jgi:hypothetical protein